jgi:hypothetical protein
MRIIGEWRKNINRVGCYNRAENAKMCLGEQCFAQRIPLLCTKLEQNDYDILVLKNLEEI